ncbi:MAG: hypothetical protein MUE81_15630 [Thermoflexibacter sp.]|jgi:hypothetical protein|nr:hypothetical protein [Thermoflexibacter sp.]
MALPIGFYKNDHETHHAREQWELLIERDEEQMLVFQLHIFSEKSYGYSESWCEGKIEVLYDFLFFKEKIGFHWDWKDTDNQYHLVEIKDGFKAVFDHQEQGLKIGNVHLFVAESPDITEVKERFAEAKQQLNELLVMKNLYPTEFW